MESTTHKQSYLLQLESLIQIIDTANERIVSKTPDSFFQENANFFTKSFLVIMCAYLESYIKDALMVIVSEINEKLTNNSIKYNLVKWSLNIEKEFKDTEWKSGMYKIRIKKNELDPYISGNPFRTRDLFKKFGILLDEDEIFVTQKDRINTLVTKRNKVIHYNDDASDISNSDLKENIKLLSEYISNLDRLICLEI